MPINAAALEARPGSYGNRYEAAARQGSARYVKTPEGEFSYGSFNQAEIEYNLKGLK